MQYFDHSFTLDYPMNLIVSSDHFINFNSSVDTKYWTGIYEKVPNVVLNGRPMWIDSDLTNVIVFGGKEKTHFSICMLILKHISVENRWIVGDTAQQNRRFVSPTTSSFLLPDPNTTWIYNELHQNYSSSSISMENVTVTVVGQYYVFACTYSYITIILSNLTEWKSGFQDSYTVSSDHPGHLDPLMGIYRKVPGEQQNGKPVFKNVLSNFYMFYDGLYLILFILMYKA